MFRRPKETDDQSFRRGGDPFGWNIPPAFNAARDIVDALARDPVKPALTYVAGDGTVDVRTFADMARESVRWSRLMLEHTSLPGSRVAIALDPGTHWAAAILGAMRVGLLPVLLGRGIAPTDLAARLAALEPSLIVVDHRSEPGARRAIEGLPEDAEHHPAVLTLEEAQWSLMRAGGPTPHVEESVFSPAFIVYTAGTATGRPRPVLHRHTSAFATRVLAREWLGSGQGDLVLSDTGGGGSAATLWTGLFGPWSTGAAVLHFDPEVSPEERVELIERFEPTIAVGNPTTLRELVGLVSHENLHLSRLRTVASTGATLDDGLRVEVLAALGLGVRDGYGTAETGIIAFQPLGSEPQPGSIGIPAPGHVVAAVDENGLVAASGVVGDLGVFDRPPSLCASYWTGWPPTEEITDGSWTLTGDRAFADQDGWLRLAERAPTLDIDEAALLWRYAPFDPDRERFTAPETASARV